MRNYNLYLLFVAMILLIGCTTPITTAPLSNNDQLVIPESTTSHIKAYGRFIVNPNFIGNWNKTNINIDEGDMLLIFTEGKGTKSVSMCGNLLLTIGGSDPQYAAANKFPIRDFSKACYGYFMSHSSGEVKFGFRRKSKGDYTVDFFVISESDEMYLLQTLNELMDINYDDELFLSQAISFIENNNWIFYSQVDVASSPPNASVYIDEELKGNTPLTIKNVIKHDFHKICIKLDDYSEYCDTFTPKIKSRFHVELIKLQQNSPSYNPEMKSSKQVSPFISETTFPKSQNAENNLDSIAVVIGNQEYSHKDVPSVSYAGNDASAVKKYLIDSLGYKDGNIIFHTNTTKATFEMIFGTKSNHRGMLYNYVKPNKSNVFIYYSGHGSPDPNTNKAYLVPKDCNPIMMDLTAYPLDILYGNIPKIEAKSVTVVIDACFSGGTSTGKWLVPNASPALLKVINPVTTQNNLTILTSAENNQVSSWYPEKQHSLFTFFFLKAVMGDADLNQDKQITFQEIYSFVADRTEGVPYYAKRLHGGRMQNPTMHAANKDAVFVQY